MSDLQTYEKHLPNTLEDVAHFAVLGAGKLKVLKAEISAIKQLNLAKEVYDQKIEEQRQLSELVLDAYTKIGEFTKLIPKANGLRTDLQPTDSTVERLQPKTKAETVSELGFSPKQVERFEKLSDNRDLVEQVKAEARESGTIPTATKVLDLAKRRKEEIQQEQRNTRDEAKIYKRFSDTIYSILLYEYDDIDIQTVASVSISVSDEIETINKAIARLEEIKTTLIRKGAENGKKTGIR